MDKVRRYERIKKYNKENYVRFHLKIHNTREDIIAHLEKQKSKNGYLVSLIEKDMEEQGQK